ncbi:DUF4238 domain-containing protein [Pseudovibrio ascidiaceicola]|uniref:DUF4238 domain-containing protein n=1 Tax=Pseudovibrio ascidiaceicola TaxID=285279 RepID=UPI003D3699FB
MSSSNPSIDHHFIPSFYIKNWDRGDGQIYEFKRASYLTKPKHVGPKSTGYQTRLYEMKGFAPEHAQQVEERFFKPLDDKASKILNQMKAEQTTDNLSEKQRIDWARFLNSLRVRTPLDIDYWRKFYLSKLAQPVIEEELSYQEKRKLCAPITLAEAIKKEPIEVKEKVLFETYIRSIINNEVILKYIIDMQWHVIHLPKKLPSLITSDRPIIISGGLIDSSLTLSLPLTPKLLFAAFKRPRTDYAIQKVNWNTVVQETNQDVIQAAVHYAYSDNIEQEPLIKSQFFAPSQPSNLELIFDRYKSN